MLTPPLALTLLMTGILADHENLAVASDNLAFVTHLLYRRANFHFPVLSDVTLKYIFAPQPQAIVVKAWC